MRTLAILSVLLLCGCAPEQPQSAGIVIMPNAQGSIVSGKTINGVGSGITIGAVHHDSPPPGCEIVEDHPGFYAVSIPVQSVNVGADGATVKVTGHYSLAPYALYDTRQGAIDCAWLCYRPAK